LDCLLDGSYSSEDSCSKTPKILFDPQTTTAPYAYCTTIVPSRGKLKISSHDGVNMIPVVLEDKKCPCKIFLS